MQRFIRDFLSLLTCGGVIFMAWVVLWPYA